jgi:hypothetical protein
MPTLAGALGHVAVDVESWRRVERGGRTERESDHDDDSVRGTRAQVLRRGEHVVDTARRLGPLPFRQAADQVRRATAAA